MVFTETHWSKVLEKLSEIMDEKTYDTWIKDLNFVEHRENEIVLEAVNEFSKRWIESRFLQSIDKYCQEIAGEEYDISIQPRELAPLPQNGEVPAATVPQGNDAPPPRTKYPTKYPTLQLNDLYTFENFVIGPSNQFCYATAMAVTENLGTTYNPLFLHGPVGLGKTHLLQAICWRLLEKKADMSIVYTSCDDFINQFISAIQQGGLQQFRYKYRYVDVLIIDDIHYLAQKERTQEEFFHIFNNLYSAQKQIIISSDSPPKEIPAMEERLVSRFKWGVVAELEPPSYETRVAIVNKKARLREAELPHDVVDYIAQNISQNVRELEGAVLKLKGYSALIGERITIKVAKKVLKDLVQAPKVQINISDIQEEVTKHYQVKLSDLQSKKRSQSIAVPRQVCMYLARKQTDLSLDEIGGYFGGRDHSTVMHSIEKIEKEMDKDGILKTTIYDIIDRLKQRGQPNQQ